MLDKLRLILYLILIFIGLIALLYIAPIFLIVSIIILWMGIKDLDKRENKKDFPLGRGGAVPPFRRLAAEGERGPPGQGVIRHDMACALPPPGGGGKRGQGNHTVPLPPFVPAVDTAFPAVGTAFFRRQAAAILPPPWARPPLD